MGHEILDHLELGAPQEPIYPEPGYPIRQHRINKIVQFNSLPNYTNLSLYVED